MFFWTDGNKCLINRVSRFFIPTLKTIFNF